MNNRILTFSDVLTHGAYINDLVHGNKCKKLKEITHDDAAVLLNIPEEIRKHEYMWQNKGWILIGTSMRIRPAYNEQSEFYKTYRPPTYKKGDRCVYLHDGRYALYEFLVDEIWV